MVETLKEKTCNARKKYYCMLCGCEIPVGSKYIRQTNKCDDCIYDFITHRECFELSGYTDVIGTPWNDGWDENEFSAAVDEYMRRRHPILAESKTVLYDKVKLILAEAEKERNKKHTKKEIYK